LKLKDIGENINENKIRKKDIKTTATQQNKIQHKQPHIKKKKKKNTRNRNKETD
jgi:hypothetical protein